jgi:hypothetical protein
MQSKKSETKIVYIAPVHIVCTFDLINGFFAILFAYFCIVASYLVYLVCDCKLILTRFAEKNCTAKICIYLRARNGTQKTNL